jgi:peptidoglycan/xylan/chitin deacetylase (PgdA/CDA1 family)
VPRGVRLDAAQLETVRAAAASVRQQATAERTNAITIDDLPTASVLGEDIERAERTTRGLLGALRRVQVPAIGFVNERKLQPSGKVDPRRVALLQQWIDAGFDLGNHTFSHPDLHRVDVAAFEQDVVKGDVVTRRLLAQAGREPRYFRHPFLHTGRSREVRDRTHALLARRGYMVAPVTVDNYDYVFAAAYDRALASDDDALATRITTAYLDYMTAVVGYYEEQSVAIVGRPMSHTLLLHANTLNAATIERLVERLRSRGYRFVSLDEALQDPAYKSKDEYFGQAGITWLHRWALTAGRKGIFAGEPAVPEWITKAAGQE